MNTRSGNAIIMAFGIAAMIGTMVVISTTSSTQVVVDTSHRSLQLRCLAAVEAVLHGRESSVVAMAADGSLLTWTGELGQDPNFGEDNVGGCRVRWKIEPMRTIMASEAPNAPTNLPYVTNPTPAAGTPVLAVNEVNNTVSYLYRISAEAAIVDSSTTPELIIARAQGVRAIAASNNPLFRYVIFYAAQGPKGDLELSHGPALNIQGNVFSNGSIYFGSNVSATDWNALSGPTGPTTITTAVAGRSAYVAGMEGIYRMSKPLMYAYLNNLPINSAPASPGTVTDSIYDLTTARYPNEATGPTLSSFAAATNFGRIINPRRVKSATGLIPGGTQPRTINGIEVSSDNTNGNDARDLERPSTRTWGTTSSDSGVDTFGRMAQSQDTGARGEIVDQSISGSQALEAQLLQRIDTDGDSTTDEHEAYRPLFYDAAGNVTTTLPDTPPVEVPGTYLAFALGSNVAMQRRADNSGWNITTPTGGVPGAATSTALVIRERLVPDVNLWPGPGVAMNPMPANNPAYLPYAYGKHWRPALMPAVPIDVTENLTDANTDAAWQGILTGGSNPPTLRTADVPERWKGYVSGSFTLHGAASGGPGASTETMTASVGSSGQSYIRKHWYARDNWRFLHLKFRHALTDAQILALPQGLRAYAWVDDDHGMEPLPNGDSDSQSTRLLGLPDWTGIDAVVDSSIPWAPNAAGNPPAPAGFNNDYYSVRWDGYLIPPASSAYTFQVTHDDGLRIWIDDQLVYERWDYPGGGVQTSVPVALSINRPARIVMEFQEGAGGDNCTLSWSSTANPISALIPNANLRAAPTIPGFDRTMFQSVVAQVNLGELRAQVAAVPNHKAGLMLRDASGTPNMVSGRDRYLMFGVNATRGFFVEQRMEPSVETRIEATATDYWVADGSYTANGGPSVPDVSGQLGIPTDRTATVGGVAYVVNRTSNIKKSLTTVSGINKTANNYGSTSDVTIATSTPSSAGLIQLDESTSMSGLLMGPWTKSRTYSRQARERWYISGTFEYDFVTYRGVFPPSPYTTSSRPVLTVFNDSSTATTTATEATWAANTYTIFTKNYAIGGNGPALRRTVTGGSQYGAYSAAKVVTNTSGDASSNAIWKPSGGWPAGWSGAMVVSALNNFNSGAGYGGVNTWHLGGGSGNEPGTPGITAPTWTLAELADPATSPTAPTDLDGNEHSISVSLTNTYALRVDNNPWTGGGSQWGAVAVNQTRPWLSAWQTGFNLTPVTTRSFRPDLWWSGAAAPSATNLAQAKSATVPQGTPAPAMDDVLPAGWAGLTSVWMRIVQAADGTISCQYADGASIAGTGTNPWIAITTQPITLGNPASPASNTVWDRSLLVGPCIQSGSATQAMDTTFSNVQVFTTEAIGNGDNVWDQLDWDAVPLPGTGSPMSRYLASQYQVFMGNQDITEDFFGWSDQLGVAPIAQENWFYQTREFWSQSRFWDDGTEKDGANPAITTNRRLLAKATVLDIDCQQLWAYMTSRSLTQATTRVMSTNNVVPGADGTVLTGIFNGLIYAVRTNRYPVNPSLGSTNPWSADSDTLTLPNDDAATQYANLQTMVDPGMVHNGVHKLQPYGLAAAPPFKPQNFPHGVMLSNGSNTSWGFATAGANPPLGTGATSFVTPNPLYINGDFNSVNRSVTVGGGPTMRPVPVAIMADSIYFLSNQFSFANYQVDDFTGTATGFNGAGILGRAMGMPVTSNATYQAAIVTYNQPTTLARVQEGQSAAVIDTMLFLESWGTGRTVNYLGSLVVLGTKRYTSSFLLNVPKVAGTSPFGVIGTDWLGNSMQVYNAPNRVLNYNTDLLTPQGTPPFTPSGVTTASVGGWVRVVQ